MQVANPHQFKVKGTRPFSPLAVIIRKANKIKILYWQTFMEAESSTRDRKIHKHTSCHTITLISVLIRRKESNQVLLASLCSCSQNELGKKFGFKIGNRWEIQTSLILVSFVDQLYFSPAPSRRIALTQ